MFEQRVEVLDHGYVGLVESWGSDERIIESARMSTSKSFEGWAPLCVDCVGASGKLLEPQPGEGASCSRCGSGALLYSGDEKLLRRLYTEGHSTPFEFAGITIEVQAPIVVFREWHRHRVPFGYSELSARYTPLPDVSYVPSIERLLEAPDAGNRQAGVIKGAGALTEEGAEEFQRRLVAVYDAAEQLYRWALGAGVRKELARLPIAVGRYSRMRVTGNLRGWLNFLRLRLAPTAQWEIRQYADVVATLIASEFPRTYALFTEPPKADRLAAELEASRAAEERARKLLLALVEQNPGYKADSDLMGEIHRLSGLPLEASA